jgi:hypothetical protein
MNSLEEYYAQLGLLPSADKSVVEAAYRTLTGTLRSNGVAETDRRFKKLKAAYEAISNVSGEPTNPFGADWLYALEYFPDLRHINERFERISHELAATYRSRLLSSRDLGSRHEFARQLENEYFEKKFGRNGKLIAFAREVIGIGQYEAAEELSHACQLFGGDHDPDAIIARIRGKYFLFSTSAGEICTDHAVRILRYAVEQGHQLTVSSKNVITLRKGTSETFFYSLDQIIRYGTILGVR